MVSQKPVLEIVFREHAQASIGKKFTSLFPGLGYAAGYKVMQVSKQTHSQSGIVLQWMQS